VSDRAAAWLTGWFVLIELLRSRRFRRVPRPAA